jgi:hypothetical protein
MLQEQQMLAWTAKLQASVAAAAAVAAAEGLQQGQ